MEKGEREQVSTSGMLNDIREKHVVDNVNIGDLIASMNEGGFAFINMLSAIILMVPTPPPIAIVMAFVIMFFSYQMFVGRKSIWLPKYVTTKSIPRHILATAIEKTNIYLFKIEKLTHRRFLFMINEKMNRIAGVMMFILATVTLSPLLFANTIPGIGIVMICFGILNRDGLIVILGYIVGIVGILVAWYMVVFGATMFMKLIHRIFN
jgi:hypothetical protein